MIPGDYSLRVFTGCSVLVMTSRAARVAVLPGALSLLVLAVPAAQAQSLTIADPVGDAPTGELDLTAVTVQNRDHRVIAYATVADLTQGTVIISVDPRQGTGVRLVTSRRADGTVNGRVYAGDFTDPDQAIGGPVPCRRYNVDWDDATSTVKLSMPSTCLNAGDYGALRFAVLTEKAGRDSDFAPSAGDGDLTSTTLVARG